MPATDLALRPLRVLLARDYDPAVLTVPGVDLGPVWLTEPPDVAATRWFHAGVRKVVLPEPVDLTAETTADETAAAAAVRTLVLVRDLTSYGIVVEWRLRLEGDGDAWNAFRHLHPPTELLFPADSRLEAAEVGTIWRQKFYLDMCTYRRGPGFVQVRDRRAGELSLITIDDPDYLAVLARLTVGAILPESDLAIARDFAAEALVTTVGPLSLWLPYRIRRWPLPSSIV